MQPEPPRSGGRLTPLGMITLLLVLIGAGYLLRDTAPAREIRDLVESWGVIPSETPEGQNPGSVPRTPTPQALRGSAPTIQVGTVQFGTYLSAVGATKFAAERGVNIQLIDLSNQEGIQCDWVAGRLQSDRPPAGVPRILFTTHNAARVCDDVKVVMVIDQSSGADTFITRSDVAEFSQIFRSPVTMPGDCSVSEYFYRTVAWAFGVTDQANLRLTAGPDQAVAGFRADQAIKTLVVYEPAASDARQQNPGVKDFLTTQNWAGILDVGVIKAEAGVNDAVTRFLAAWFDFVRFESENYDQAWQVLVEYHRAHPETTYLRDYTQNPDILRDELTNLVAQASFADNVRMLVTDTNVMQARLNEVDAVQREFPCRRLGQVPRPSAFSTRDMIDGRYVQALQNDSGVQGNTRTISKRRITLSTSIPLEQAVGSASQRLIGQLSDVYIEFLPDSDQFADENAARDVLERNFAAVLRLTNNTILELVGGYAFPRGCLNCTDQLGAEVALRRANRVREFMISELSIPQERVRVSPDVRRPAFAQSSDPVQVRQDRRVEGRLLVISGL